MIAVKGLDRRAILDAYARRLNNDTETERAEAIAQICRIARFRL